MTFNGGDQIPIPIPQNEATANSMYWVGNNNGYPGGIMDQSLNFIGYYASTGPFQDIGLHLENGYTKQPTCKVTLLKWNPNGTDINHPLSHIESVGFRNLIPSAIDAFKNELGTPLRLGEVVSSSWGSLWVKATVEIPSRVFKTGGCFPWRAPGEAIGGDNDNNTTIYRNRQNEIQLHYDFGGEAVIYVSKKAIMARESWFEFQKIKRQFGEEKSQKMIKKMVKKNQTVDNTDEDEFVVAQGFAAVSGADRRSQYPLYYYMADNYDITTPDVLPETLNYTFYVQNHYNSLFGNADNGDNIAPPAEKRVFAFKQFDIMHWYAKYSELYFDYGICADIAVQYNHSTFGKEANRLCQYVANILLTAKTRQNFVSNVSMRDFFSRYRSDGDIIDANNSNIVIDVYNSYYDELYTHCIEKFRVFIDGNDNNDVKFFNNLLTRPEHTLNNTTTTPTNIAIALGHAHIDTCWLWSYAQTRSKIVASWSNQLSIGHSCSYHSFTFSSGVQMKWLKEDHPQLFRILQQRVENSQKK